MVARPARTATAATAATRRIRGEETSRKAVAATPAPAIASRKKWFAVTTIENTTRAGYPTHANRRRLRVMANPVAPIVIA